MDPPDHTRLRALVSQAFTAQAISRLSARVQAIADDLLNSFDGRTSIDLVGDYAWPLTATMIGDMLGVPRRDYEWFKTMAGEMFPYLDAALTPELGLRAHRATGQFRVYFSKLIEEHVRAPREDLITALVDAEQEGSKLTRAELVGLSTFLLAAGHETTVNLVSNGMLALLEHPSQLEKLTGSNASTWRVAVEEMLRYDSPIQMTGRLVREHLEVAGKTLRPGESVVLVIGSANRDPERFREPDRFDIHRENNHHVAFAAGLHFCLGAPLARMEAQIALRGLFQRFPGLRLSGDEIERRETVTLRGPRSLTVRLG
jgi:pimeloyl-[acyl-carrier protein] synthase